MLHTADLCDKYFPDLQVANPGLHHYSRQRLFNGPITTVQVDEDSGLVKAVIAEPGEGRVLIIDGGGSMRRALTGEKMAGLAHANGWAGLVFNGCIRDADEVADLDIGILALGTCPVRPAQTGAGLRDIAVQFNGVRFTTGSYLYADGDGMIISERVLNLDDGAAS